ncbi:AAA family ATPase [Nitrosomonas sp. Nm51]|uniref:AAA family ATPase n=1 Tax=Nitrosomonas sp. Nm51 TaxID=133720 RepID=UPI001C431B99|nr:AAA family ATPase [Nitrosomonas sp. Nm51]
MNEPAEINEFSALLRARVPLILIETHEEPRILKLLTQASSLENQLMMRWSIVDGLGRVAGTGGGTGQFAASANGDHGKAIYQTNELIDCLRHIDKSSQNGVYVLCDAHPGFKDAVAVRLIREIAMDHASCARTLVFVSPVLEDVPSELLRLAGHFKPKLPTRDDIRSVVVSEAQLYHTQNGDKVRGDRRTVDLLIMHLLGLEFEDVRRLVRQALRADGEINQDDIRRILTIKHRALGGEGVLGFEESSFKFDAIGGLVRMKHWVALRQKPFLDPKTAALDRPRGILLLGVMGGGKSLAARAVAGEWNIPLMRLDFGAMYNKFYGESERNLRAALAAAEGMAPCVLWIDELEKGLGGNGGEQDGGVSRRILGTFLTWLSERSNAAKPVFIVATANDISTLPPELIRKGRFDEIFFVDFPNTAAREQIFTIHLKKRGFDPAAFDLAALAANASSFSGAEIEQAVIAAIFEAAARDGEHALTSTDVLHELERTRPLSVVMAERIGKLRAWAHDRAVLADDLHD